jgi:hemerythrin-like domain-containing protein
VSDETTLNPAIHAAFRRDLSRFDDALDVLDPDDRRRADQLVAAWDNFSYQLHRHHQDEESFFWPAFRELGVDPAIVDALNAEHDVMVRALTDADAAMRVLGSDSNADNAKRARIAIAELARILGDHLDHEQRDLDPFSVQHKHAKQHKAAERAARRAHTEGAGTFFAWLSDGCNEDARRIVRREVPPPVLWLITRIGGRDYTKRIAATWA